jgi:predicted nucleotide-binding protein
MGTQRRCATRLSTFLRKATGAEPTVPLDEPNRGLTLIEKFKDAATRACFAIVLATADDIGPARTPKEDNDAHGRTGSSSAASSPVG